MTGLLIARSRVVLWHTYIGYLWMVIVGMWHEVAGMLSKMRNSDEDVDERAPLGDTGFFDFYLRRIYRRVEHCWNNPISSAPGKSFELMARARSAERYNELVPTGESMRVLNLGSYNYLGFGGVDQRCTPAAADVLIKHGLSLGSSRAEAGTLAIHLELEALCARFVRKPACVVVPMGFTTNTLTLPVLVGPGCLVISDALNHSSIVEGVRRSGAKTRVFRHNDVQHLEELLIEARDEEPGWRKVLIVVEGIYSMEGHFSPIKEVVELKKKYGVMLYLDEAHSIGAVGPTGRGVSELFDIDPADIDVMMGTFSKSFGAMGGYVCATEKIIASLKRNSASYNEAPAPPPLVCAQVIESMKIIMGEDGTSRGKDKLAALKENANYFRDSLRAMGCEVLGDPGSPVVPLMIYHPQKLISFSDECRKRGVAVVVVGAPATPLLEGRARFCISSAHTRADIDFALKAIGETADAVGVR
jgi:serine palmitoyltransferase